MSWNNRVIITESKYPNGSTEKVAQIHEVYYNDGKSGQTENPSCPIGTGDTNLEAVKELKKSLLLQLEAVEYVLNGDTSIYDENDISTHNPGKNSLVLSK